MNRIDSTVLEKKSGCKRMDKSCHCRTPWQRITAKSCLLLIILFTVLLNTEGRPFFSSRFYMDEQHIRGYGDSHYDTRHDNEQIGGRGTDARHAELRFVSFDRNTKRLVENNIDLSKLNQNTRYNDYFLMPFLDDDLRGKSKQRTRFAVMRKPRRLNYRKRPHHGLLGLWG